MPLRTTGPASRFVHDGVGTEHEILGPPKPSLVEVVHASTALVRVRHNGRIEGEGGDSCRHRLDLLDRHVEPKAYRVVLANILVLLVGEGGEKRCDVAGPESDR